MHVLILNDSGPDLAPTRLIRDGLLAKGREHQVTTLVPARDLQDASVKCGPVPKRDQVKSIGKDDFVVDALPLDLVDFAMQNHELWAPRGFDLVLIGVAKGHPLGTEVLRHTATLMAMHTALSYHQQVAVVTASDPSRLHPKSVTALNQVIDQDLRDIMIGEVLHLNFPPVDPIASARTTSAHYQPSRLPPVNLVPRARDEKSDATYGPTHITLTKLLPRLQQKAHW